MTTTSPTRSPGDVTTLFARSLTLSTQLHKIAQDLNNVLCELGEHHRVNVTFTIEGVETEPAEE